ncbi:MAG: type II toxin-antitoxin system CcdA family antitoxin [Rhodocyclaceae bacterium]|nr:type II toxin-antitoxin system CcdA family antitoxin [Rhodocyclaceae bacterium]
MNQIITPARKATNITLSADVLTEAKALGINISKSCDDFLRDLVARERASRWRTDHAEFIDAYNKIVAEEGLPLEQWRNF